MNEIAKKTSEFPGESYDIRKVAMLNQKHRIICCCRRSCSFAVWFTCDWAGSDSINLKFKRIESAKHVLEKHTALPNQDQETDYEGCEQEAE